MGKKHLKVQADPEEEEDILNDPDFEAEMKALESLRAEREADQGKKQDDAGSVQTNKNGYNRDALMKCVEDSESAGLPFVETLRVDEFDLTINNELDDVEREVRITISLCSASIIDHHIYFATDEFLQSRFVGSSCRKSQVAGDWLSHSSSNGLLLRTSQVRYSHGQSKL